MLINRNPYENVAMPDVPVYYTKRQLDAAVAAERERWTLLLTEKWHAGDGKGQTLAQYMGMTDAEYAAWVLKA